MSKQDRQGVRKASDIEQKYGLGQFMYDQRQSNQEFNRDLINLSESLSSYKTENDQKLSTMKDEVDNSISSVEKELSGNIDALAKGIFNMIYPVGSIYISVSATNPSTLFGGTWEQIQDTFLLAAGSIYSAGATGGEATHTLSANEMPSHRHAPSTRDTAGSESGYKRFFTTNLATGSDSVKRATVGSGGSNYGMVATTSADINEAEYTSYVGGGAAHNNMPPYLAVYVWKRTA